jgi:HSP20 family protein
MLPVPVRRRRETQLAEPFNWMERAFDRMVRPWLGEELSEGWTATYPVDIREEEGKVLVDAELPGFKPEEVDVNVDRGMLHIVAEHKEGEQKRGKTHLNERRYTRVERMFSLPADVDASHAEAHLSDGVLHLELPETEESKPKQIKVA